MNIRKLKRRRKTFVLNELVIVYVYCMKRVKSIDVNYVHMLVLYLIIPLKLNKRLKSLFNKDFYIYVQILIVKLHSFNIIMSMKFFNDNI